MPKAAKTEKPVIVTNVNIKDYTKRLLAVNAEIKDFTDSRKDLLAEAKSNGVDTKALKAAVKIIESAPEQEEKDKINFYLDANGQGRFFA
jgi:uncharacterized protein (UPF0335 family)